MGHAPADGIRDLEGQHHLQLDLLTAFRQALRGAASANERVEILDHLADYTQVHFAAEQLLMRLYAYPQFQEHLADHERALEQLESIRCSIRDDDAGMLAEADRLSALVSKHIDGADQRLAEFLSGVRAPSAP